MGLLAPLARLLGIEIDVLLKQFRENALAIAAIGVFTAIGLVFLLIAANTALTWYVGPLWAPLIIAGAAFVLAIAVWIADTVRKRSLRRRVAEVERASEAQALVASAAISALPALLSSSAIRSVGLPLALYAGFLLFSGRHKSTAASSASEARPRRRRTAAT
jgi:hypothetical protein